MRLEATNVGFRHGRESWIFRGAAIHLEPGEIVGLVGPSGCGKTTLGRILAGYDAPSEGEVRLGGRPLPRAGYHPVRLVFQHPEKAVHPRRRMRRIASEGWEPDSAFLRLFGIEEEWMDRHQPRAPFDRSPLRQSDRMGSPARTAGDVIVTDTSPAVSFGQGRPAGEELNAFYPFC